EATASCQPAEETIDWQWAIPSHPFISAIDTQVVSAFHHAQATGGGRGGGPAWPSYSTEDLSVEMANLEGLMKDLNAITASEFEC
ncbi:hypothetical protein TNIN_490941, partial [Trichonephila inaurata madagascariensis]